MKKLAWFVIAIILSGAALDIYTTEILLATGCFAELNPLFYALGRIGFLLLYWSSTLLVSMMVMIYDQRNMAKGKIKLYRVSMAGLSFFGMFHWFIGARQLLMIAQFLMMGGML